MTLPAPRRGRILLIVAAAAAACTLGSLPAAAQQPAAAPAAAPAATAPAPAGSKAAKTPAKGTAAAAEQGPKSERSYSIGILWGTQLRSTGVAPDSVSVARIDQGIRDALSGKVTMSDQDKENIRAMLASGVESNHHAAEKFLAENGKKPGVVTTASGLQYQELKAGSGASPKASDTVLVNYRGTLLDGTEFDASSRHGGQPASFEVDRVIPGWTEAMQLMKPGAKWKLYIPPRLAYDLRPPSATIPPGSLLVFEVELVSVKAAPPPSASPAPPANPAPAIPQSAMPKPTGKPPVNPSENPNSPPPAAIAPASK